MGRLARLPRLSRGVFRQEFDKMFEDLFPEVEAEGDAIWAPRMDVAEDENSYSVVMDLPGIAKEDVDVEMQDGCLSVRGERKLEKDEKEANYQRMERAYGSFYRSLTLPKTVDPESIEATFKDGVLKIKVPKVEEAKAQRIAIR